MFSTLSHVKVLPVATRVMNARNHTGQASVTSSGPFRDCSCQFVHRPQNSRSVDTRQVNAFKEDCGANVHTQECQVCRCATNLGASGRFESKRLVILPPLPVPPSSTGDRRSKAWRRHTSARFVFANSQYRPMHFLRMSFHIIGLSDVCFHIS